MPQARPLHLTMLKLGPNTGPHLTFKLQDRCESTGPGYHPGRAPEGYPPWLAPLTMTITKTLYSP